jgi:hypothetical protein
VRRVVEVEPANKKTRPRGVAGPGIGEAGEEA